MSPHLKGKSFVFLEKLVKEGYPPDTLYYVGSFTNEKGQKLLVLDGAGEDVVLVPESDVMPANETANQEQMNVLVDISQIMKLTYHKLSEIHDAVLKPSFMTGDPDDDEELPPKKKKINISDLN